MSAAWLDKFLTVAAQGSVDPLYERTFAYQVIGAISTLFWRQESHVV
jgi:hypothetical protein